MDQQETPTLIKDHQGNLGRWAEYFGELLNRINPADPTRVERLPSLPPLNKLGAIPAFSEVQRDLKGHKNNKVTGLDGIPREIQMWRIPTSLASA